MVTDGVVAVGSTLIETLPILSQTCSCEIAESCTCVVPSLVYVCALAPIIGRLPIPVLCVERRARKTTTAAASTVITTPNPHPANKTGHTRRRRRRGGGGGGGRLLLGLGSCSYSSRSRVGLGRSPGGLLLLLSIPIPDLAFSFIV